MNITNYGYNEVNALVPKTSYMYNRVLLYLLVVDQY